MEYKKNNTVLLSYLCKHAILCLNWVWAEMGGFPDFRSSSQLIMDNCQVIEGFFMLIIAIR